MQFFEAAGLMERDCCKDRKTEEQDERLDDIGVDNREQPSRQGRRRDQSARDQHADRHRQSRDDAQNEPASHDLDRHPCHLRQIQTGVYETENETVVVVVARDFLAQRHEFKTPHSSVERSHEDQADADGRRVGEARPPAAVCKAGRADRHPGADPRCDKGTCLDPPRKPPSPHQVIARRLDSQHPE